MKYDNIMDNYILNFIQNNQISEQSDLQKLLAAKGYNLPQATLSRKLKKLKIAKVSGLYKLINVNHSSLPLIINIQISEFGLIVLHTHPGQANSLAYFLDQKYIFKNSNSGIIGTIAGDDTVLVIIKSKQELKKILDFLQADFPYLEIN